LSTERRETVFFSSDIFVLFSKVEISTSLDSRGCVSLRLA